MLADKTGSLIAASGEFGLRFSGAPADLIDPVRQYGEKVGVAFQLADDIIDLTSDAATSGKRPGTDLRERVPTLPVLLPAVPLRNTTAARSWPDWTATSPPTKRWRPRGSRSPLPGHQRRGRKSVGRRRDRRTGGAAGGEVAGLRPFAHQVVERSSEERRLSAGGRRGPCP